MALTSGVLAMARLGLGAVAALCMASAACASSADHAPAPTLAAAPAATMQPIPDGPRRAASGRRGFDRAEWERTNGVNGTLRPYTVAGVTYRPRHQPDYQEEGMASWYGQQFHGRRTASGQVFDMNVATVAHRTLPMGSIVEVTNLATGDSARLTVTDRGPFAHGRILDVSREGARQLGFLQRGSARVRVRYVDGDVDRSLLARAAEGVVDVATAPVRLAAAVAMAPVRAVGSMMDRDDSAENGDAAGDWAVQGGAFAERGNAERLAERLATAGSVSIRDMRTDGRTLYRVLLTGFDSEHAATRGLSQVAALGVPNARIVRGF